MAAGFGSPSLEKWACLAHHPPCRPLLLNCERQKLVQLLRFSHFDTAVRSCWYAFLFAWPPKLPDVGTLILSSPFIFVRFATSKEIKSLVAFSNCEFHDV